MGVRLPHTATPIGIIIEPTPCLEHRYGVSYVPLFIDASPDRVIEILFQNCTDRPVTIESGATIASVTEVGELAGTEIAGGTSSEATGERAAQVWASLTLGKAKLTPSEKDQLRGVVSRWASAFALNDNDVGRTTLMEHVIEVGDAMPSSSRLADSRTASTASRSRKRSNS